MANKSTFNSYGVTVSSPSGDVILNAGQNMTLLPQGNMLTFSAQIPNAVINSVTPWQPPIVSDAKAPKNSVYFSSDAGKLVYKAIDETIFPLY